MTRSAIKFCIAVVKGSTLESDNENIRIWSKLNSNVKEINFIKKPPNLQSNKPLCHIKISQLFKFPNVLWYFIFIDDELHQLDDNYKVTLQLIAPAYMHNID